MPTLSLIKRRLASIPPIRVTGTLVRLVPFIAVTAYEPVDWLFTSGKPNRYNPADINCLYCGEDEATARAEYDDFWSGVVGEKQPMVTYFAKVKLSSVLDLASPENLQKIGIAESELFAPWRTAKESTLTQSIGQAVQEGAPFSAIRYRSRAAKDAGFQGFNLVIFRDRVERPDLVRILGPTSKPLQKWP